MTLTLNKSIAAIHLNKKTGVPLSEPEANIPFGAIVQYIGEDRDAERFTYLGELYRCPSERLKSALDGGKIATEPPSEPAQSAPKAAAPEVAPATAAPRGLHFERLTGNSAAARAKVPGGWLVTVGTGVTFYPDANHSWDGQSVNGESVA